MRIKIKTQDYKGVFIQNVMYNVGVNFPQKIQRFMRNNLMRA